MEEQDSSLAEDRREDGGVENRPGLVHYCLGMG